MFFLSIANGLGIKGQDGEVTFRGTLLSFYWYLCLPCFFESEDL